MAEKSLSLKFGAAIYYMVASMVVQFVNKVCTTRKCDASDAVPPTQSATGCLGARH